jgi:hypothetical protein
MYHGVLHGAPPRPPQGGTASLTAFSGQSCGIAQDSAARPNSPRGVAAGAVHKHKTIGLAPEEWVKMTPERQKKFMKINAKRQALRMY